MPQRAKHTLSSKTRTTEQVMEDKAQATIITKS